MEQDAYDAPPARRFAVILLPRRQAFVHDLRSIDGQASNDVVRTDAALPNPTQKVESYLLVDADTLAPPFSLRLWQPGDTIHPLGFNHTRKVSDVLKDLKLSRYDKRYVWLLVDSAGTIVWIVGLVQNHLFRTTSRTARVLHICLENC
jgi:tRNA(Ile)-lysidine synthetase-like protein